MCLMIFSTESETPQPLSKRYKAKDHKKKKSKFQPPSSLSSGTPTLTSSENESKDKTEIVTVSSLPSNIEQIKKGELNFNKFRYIQYTYYTIHK